MKVSTEFSDPELSGFQPLYTYRVRGIGHMSLAHDSGVRLDLSADGLAEVSVDPAFKDLLSRMVPFIAEHDGYDKPGFVLRGQDVRQVVLSHAKPQRGNDAELPADVADDGDEPEYQNSVYLPNDAPGHIIKAYDHGSRLAGVQFHIGSWLHRTMGHASSTVYFPRQFAVLTAPDSGHRTAVMERVPGESLWSIGKRLDGDETTSRPELNHYLSTIQHHIQYVVHGALGEYGLLIVNDLKNIANIIIDTTEPVDVHHPLDRRVAVIDQPMSAESWALAWHALSRRMTRQKWQSSVQRTPVSQPESLAA